MTNLQENLKAIYEMKIDFFEYNVYRNRVNMSLSTQWDGRDETHTLNFLGISTFYSIFDSNPEGRKKVTISEKEYDEDYNDGAYLELDFVLILDHLVETKILTPKGEIPQYNWLDECDGGGNVLLNVGARSFILESKAIELDGKTYSLIEN